jgi:hypothetical protein
VAPPSVAVLVSALRIGAGLDLEVAGGELPTAGLSESEVSMTVTAVPRLALLDEDPGSDAHLSYAPRFFYRYPDSLLLGRPTLLHQLEGSYATFVDRKSELGFNLAAAHGESDFTATQAVFGQDQFVAPEDTITDVTYVSGGPSASTRIDRRTTLRLLLPAGYQTTAGQTTTIARTSWNVGVGPGVTHRLGPRDTLDLAVPATYTDTELSVFLQSEAFLSWGHEISRRWTSSLGAGVSRVDRLESVSPDSTSHFALAQAGVSHREALGSESAFIALSADVDPILAEVRPRATATITATQILAKNLTLSEDLAASSAAASDPLPADPNETVVSTSVSMGWRATHILTLRWGARLGGAGPHWKNGLEPRQRTLQGFVGLSLFYPPSTTP